MRISVIALSAIIFCAAGRANAQSLYVGASVVADVVRFSGPSGGLGDSIGNGETIGGSLRIGTAVSNRWGVDLEFVRPGRIESTPNFRILQAGRPTIPAVLGVPSGILPEIFPPVDVVIRQRFTTLSTMVWARQSLGARVDLVYLGGVAFTRATSESRFEFVRLGGVGRDSLDDLIGPIAPIESRTVSYDAGPSVGIDLRVSMTEHLRLVPGMRLLVVDNAGQSGWITRPSVGLIWMF
jgi:hypothetical protein